MSVAAPENPPSVAASSERRAVSLFQPDIVRRALLDSVLKLDPRVQIRNPVMFVVQIGAVITTVSWLAAGVRRRLAGRRPRARLVHIRDRRLVVADGHLRQPRRSFR